jgi:hypothetical protein
MTSKAKKAWDELNKRQQIYLETIYHADQAAETAHHKEAARTWSNTPARVWRRLPFNGPYSYIAPALRHHKVYDTGAGATLAALRDRGLIESETWTGLLADQVHVWITREGRAAVRAGLGLQSARANKPKWALSEWLWREMARVAAAGPDGLLQDLDPRTRLYGEAHLYLSESQAGRRGNRPYLKYVTSFKRYEMRDINLRPYNPPAYGSRQVGHYQLTDEGRAHYTEYLEQYRELYPDIDAPDLQDPGGQQDKEQDGAPEAADQ